MFIDGPKDGCFERAFTGPLLDEFSGTGKLLVFDDIRLMTMVGFWRWLPLPKLDLSLHEQKKLYSLSLLYLARQESCGLFYLVLIRPAPYGQAQRAQCAGAFETHGGEHGRGFGAALMTRRARRSGQAGDMR